VINYIYIIGLSLALIIDFGMIIYLNKKLKGNGFYKVMISIYVVLIFYFVGLILQLTCKNSNIPLIYFDYITYIAATMLPVCILFMALMYLNKNIKLNKLLFLFIIPFISLITLFTNDFHHLFYIKYSIKINESMYGPMFIVHSIYSYFLLITSMVILVYASIKKSGFFSKQTFLIVLGSSVPLLVNIFGTVKIIPMSIYITPITFIFACICYSLAIIKYKVLNIIPVALETVTDTMSDSFVVISDDGTIADTNLTFRKTFGNVMDFSKDKNLFEVIERKNLFAVSKLKDIIKKTRKKDTVVNVEYHLEYNEKEKFFEVDIQPIKAKKDKNQYIGTLLLFKDITQHKKDIKEIEEKQEIIVKQGQLVSIGELAGGVAHDINTPISAIKTGITMLNQKEDREESEKEILQRMDNCATKIINIVNSMRNQIRNLGGTTKVKFKISDVINDIKVITFHEVYKNKSEFIVDILDDLSVEGDPTKLGQVLTNLVINAVQAYGEKGGKVEVIVEKAPKGKALIKIRDYAGGLDPEIKPYVFKNILTTKGTFGTGLGLYLAYSIIKGEFNGEINFESDDGMGTTFYISMPVA
jgi:PAS domain S-box-containing protein